MEETKKRKIIKKIVTKSKTPIDPHQLHRGIEVEREHSSFNDGPANKSTDVVKGNKTVEAKIAAVHLKEDPKYYTHLKAMEKKYSK